MLAIVAWSLSVVDVAIVLGPGNPPTLAVLSWQWLSQGDAEQQAKGALASLLLVLLLLIIALAGYLLWRAWQRTIPAVNGERLRFSSCTIGRSLVQLLPFGGVVCALVLALIASYSSLNSEALSTSLQLGLLSSVLALLILLLAGMGSANRTPLGLATAHFACAAAGNWTVSVGVICRTGWADDNHCLGTPAVGDAMDAVCAQTGVATH